MLRAVDIDLDALFAPIAHQQMIGLAISGGADSLGLMALAAKWCGADAARPRAIVYTLDHALRSAAANEVQYVLALAGQLGLEGRALVWDEEKPETGIQAAARKARYGLIGKAMARDGVEILLTAHHLGDQAETVLMRMAHGSGIGGLAGMQRFSRVYGVSVFRPLLDIDPAGLAAVVERMGWKPVHDPSNHDVRFERVRWRQVLNGLAPMGLDMERLGLLARRAARIDDLARAQADASFSRLVQVDPFGVITIPRKALVKEPAEIVLRVLEKAIGWAGGGQRVQLGALEQLANGLIAGDFARARTLAGARIASGAHSVLVFREAGRIGAPPTPLAPGTSLVWDNRFRLFDKTRELRVAPASGMTRRKFHALFGQEPQGPIAALRAAPLVRTSDGQPVALGSRIISPGTTLAQLTLT